MYGIDTSSVEAKINSFLNRKTEQYPELHLEERLSLFHGNDREDIFVKFPRTDKAVRSIG